MRFSRTMFGSLITIAFCSGCGETEEPQADLSQADSSQTQNDSAAIPEDPAAWFVSDARPVNRACNEPGYRPGQPDTYPALHAPLYPAIQERHQEMLAQVRALAPQVTDEDMYDVEADLQVRREMNVLSQLVFLAAQDMPPRYLLSFCDVAAFQDDECALMRRMMQSTLTLEEVTFDGGSLSYTALLQSDGSRSRLRIANRDLDGLQLQRQSATDGQYMGEWLRAADGTETFAANSPEGQFSYTENPDCSGTARAVRTDEGGHPWELSWQWTSVLEPSSFTVQYSDCRVNGLNERECNSGTL